MLSLSCSQPSRSFSRSAVATRMSLTQDRSRSGCYRGALFRATTNSTLCLDQLRLPDPKSEAVTEPTAEIGS
jgi:hypothetical protein